MKRSFLVGLVLTLAVPSVALAQRGGGVSASSYYRSGGWSVITGRTVGANQNALDISAGWPGISIGFLHGASDRFDIGGSFTFNYGFEGDPSTIAPGIKPQLLMRLGFLDNGKVNLGMTIAPGPLFYFFGGGALVGITIPVGLNLGIAVADSLNLAVSFDMPLWVAFAGAAGVGVPILFGGGLEYFIDRSMALTFRLKLGPTVGTFGTSFTFVSQVGLAIKL
jgi:hypothetical protein